MEFVNSVFVIHLSFNQKLIRATASMWWCGVDNKIKRFSRLFLHAITHTYTHTHDRYVMVHGDAEQGPWCKS